MVLLVLLPLLRFNITLQEPHEAYCCGSDCANEKDWERKKIAKARIQPFFDETNWSFEEYSVN